MIWLKKEKYPHIESPEYHVSAWKLISRQAERSKANDLK